MRRDQRRQQRDQHEEAEAQLQDRIRTRHRWTGIADEQAKLDKARAAGDAKRVKDLESELANKQAFLDMARKAAADFG